MYLKFSRNEFIALEKLCAGPLSNGELARQMGKKGSYISRLAKTLIAKGLIIKLEGKLRLSDASHAQSFKLLYQSRPQAKIENWLSSYAMAVLVLSSFGGEAMPIELFWKEVSCSKPTVYKIFKKLQGAGVLNTSNHSIRTVDSQVANFANDYANNIVRIATSPLGGMRASIRVRSHVVVRVEAKKALMPFCKTGLNLLVEYGLEAVLTSYSDYYFNLNGKVHKIEPEEAFVHALLLTTLEQHQDTPVLALFMRKNHNKLRTRRLLDFAKAYNAASLAQEIDNMRRAVDYMEKI